MRCAYDARACEAESSMSNSVIKTVRIAGICETISFIALLGIAMPLRRFADMPLAVTYTGWVHGVLFLFYTGAVLIAARRLRWPHVRTLQLFIAGFIPLGPLFFDGWLRRQNIAR
jgi:integral membrane protein